MYGIYHGISLSFRRKNISVFVSYLIISSVCTLLVRPSGFAASSFILHVTGRAGIGLCPKEVLQRVRVAMEVEPLD